jgi:hypothetical protein
VHAAERDEVAVVSDIVVPSRRRVSCYVQGRNGFRSFKILSLVPLCSCILSIRFRFKFMISLLVCLFYPLPLTQPLMQPFPLMLPPPLPSLSCSVPLPLPFPSSTRPSFSFINKASFSFIEGVHLSWLSLGKVISYSSIPRRLGSSTGSE